MLFCNGCASHKYTPVFSVILIINIIDYILISFVKKRAQKNVLLLKMELVVPFPSVNVLT